MWGLFSNTVQRHRESLKINLYNTAFRFTDLTVTVNSCRFFFLSNDFMYSVSCNTFVHKNSRKIGKMAQRKLIINKSV